MLIKLAWKNIWRSKTRSLVVIIAVALGLWAGAFMMAFSLGMSEQRIRTLIANETSHFQFHHPDFKSDYDLKLAITGSDAILDKLAHDDRVSAYSPRIVLNGMSASSSTNGPALIVAIDPDKENATSALSSLLIDGEYFPESHSKPIIVGSKMAEKLKLKIRSRVVLNFQDPEGNISQGLFRVCGIFKTTNAAMNEMQVFVRRDQMANILGLEGAVYEIAVKLKDDALLSEITTEYKTSYPAVLIEDWGEIAPETKLYSKMLDQSMSMIMVIILLALIFGIINTMLMAVLERTREFGMLMAVGMRRRKVFALVMIETVFLVLVGVPLGLFIAWASISYFGHVGIDLSILAQGLESLGWSSMVYPELAASYYTEIIFQVVIAAFLAAIYPAWKALRLKPVDAIRTI